MTAQQHEDRISIVSAIGDTELDAIRAVIARVTPASTFADVQYTLSAAAKDRVVVDKVDLIGHSADQCYLHIGSWVIDSHGPVDFGNLAGTLKALDVSSIRILGCSTAVTDAGWAVLTAISNQIGIEVFGTTRYISSNDFDSTGFKATNAIAGTSNKKKPPINDKFTNLSQIGEQRAYIPSDLASDTPLIAILDTRSAWRVPGILASPLETVASGGVRLQPLVDYELLRVFPARADQHGLIYVAKDPVALREYLARLPRTETPTRSM